MIVAKTTALAAALSIVAVLSMAAAGQACADSRIATWMDENGVTHFGNTQFAPTNAESVEVAPANGMDVPATAPSSGSSNGKPSMVAIRKKPNRQTKGWRGFDGYRKSNPNRPAQKR